jgi:hypothetical protein
MSAHLPLPLNNIVKSFFQAESRVTKRTFKILDLPAPKPKISRNREKELKIFSVDKFFFEELGKKLLYFIL